MKTKAHCSFNQPLLPVLIGFTLNVKLSDLLANVPTIQVLSVVHHYLSLIPVDLNSSQCYKTIFGGNLEIRNFP